LAERVGWGVVNTQLHKEQVALEKLQRQDFNAYCPLIRRRLSHSRCVTEALRPLFPGYIFVRINPRTQRWRPLLSTFGMRTLVRCGDEPSLIKDAFVQSLKAREKG
jgi:transcriptional antiterminator RfaH